MIKAKKKIDRDTLTKEKFEELYYSNTNKELADLLDISLASVKLAVKRLGLRKGKGNWTSRKKLLPF